MQHFRPHSSFESACRLWSVAARSGGECVLGRACVLMPTVRDPAKEGQVFVARQPILNRERRVYGYELLFKPTKPIEESTTPLDQTSAKVMTDALLTIGLDTLTDGRRAF